LTVVRCLSAMRARFLLAVATTALVSLMAAPVVTAQDIGIKNPEVSTPTTLYFHLINFQDFPINTQQPDDKYTDNSQIGVATHSTNCIPNPDDVAGQGGSPFVDNQRYYGYSSPSYVEYNFEQDGKPRTHPERGISYDAVIDAAAPFYVDWYMATSTSVSNPGLPVSPDVAPIMIPNVVVKATMRASDAISVDDKAYDQGPELASGKTKAATIGGGYVIDKDAPSPGATTNGDVTYVGQPVGSGGDYLYHFRVPMTVTSNVIPRATGYNIRIDMYIDSPACPGNSGSSGEPAENYKFMIQPKVHTSAEYRPLMQMSIMDPIRLEYLHPQFVGDDLVIHTSMNSAWGNYDVNEQDPDGISVSVTGPSPATSLAKAAIVQRTHEHYHHQEAVDITYVWPYKTDRAANGLYTVEVKFMNDQRNAEAVGIAQFEIGKGTVIGCGGVQEAAEQLNDDCAKQVQADGVTQKESPGVELIGIVGVLAAALLVARRRK
jgi:hypothetical protein